MVRSVVEAASRVLPQAVERNLRRRYVQIRYPEAFERMQRLRQGLVRGYSLTGSENLNCIFIHVPKCAGVSISRALFGGIGPGHLRAADYQIIYTQQEYDRLFKFTFVRNPWDRLASAFFFLKSGGMNDQDRAFREQHLTSFVDFETFVERWINPRNITLYHHFRPQTYYLSMNGRPPHLNFVGYFENLAPDFAFICKKLGINAELAQLNATGRERDYRDLFTERMIRIVAEVYQRDIATLGYTFDNSSLPEQLAARNTAGVS
jgi:hypothetical protein